VGGGTLPGQVLPRYNLGSRFKAQYEGGRRRSGHGNVNNVRSVEGDRFGIQ
jgi:hypothetical protein